MIWIFGGIVLLTGALLIPNALYAFRQFLANRNRVWFTTYMSFLAALAFILIHTAIRTVDIVEKAKETYQDPDPEVVSTHL